ncbi:MAG TPA: hypothetical protein VGE01_13665 [Fimbriimonas sp.]
MNFVKAATLLAAVAFTASSYADAWVLAQNKTTTRGVVYHLDAAGAVNQKIVLNQLLPTDASSYAIGEMGRDSQGFEVAYTTFGNEGIVLQRYTADGQMWDRQEFFDFSGVRTEVLGFCDFNGDGNAEMVVFRPETFSFNTYQLGVGGNRFLIDLDVRGIDFGTYIQPIGVSDLDGDGDCDIEMVDPNTQKVKDLFFEGKKAVQLRQTAFNSFLILSEWVGVADVDHNGSGDLFAWKEGYDLKVVFRDGLQRMGTAVLIPNTRFQRILAVGDSHPAIEG